MTVPVVDPYETPHPDGPLDPDEFPTSLAGMSWLWVDDDTSLAGIPWLDDEDPWYDDSLDSSSPSSVIPSKPF